MLSRIVGLGTAGIIAAAVAGAVMMAGCGKQPIAVVGQEKITRAQFMKKLEEDFGRDVLVHMIDRKLVKQEFEEQGLTLDPNEVQETLERVREQAGSAQALARRLQQQGSDEGELIDQIRFQLMMQKLCTHDVDASEESLREFFNQNKEQFHMPRRMGYSEIVVGSKQEAEKLADQLKNADADFGELARQHSTNPSTRPQGGKVAPRPMQYISPDQIRTTLEQLEPGQISAPVQVGGRWYILRLDNVLPERDFDFEKDRDIIARAYKAQKSKQPEQLRQELRQEASVEIVAQDYSDLNELFQQPSELPQFGNQPGAQKGVGGPSGSQRPPQARPGGAGAKQKSSAAPRGGTAPGRSGRAAPKQRSPKTQKQTKQGSAKEQPAQTSPAAGK